MSQARICSGVMAQRSEPHDSLDDFPTPPWAARAFCHWLDAPRDQTVWEPAANRGYLAKGLRDHFDTVWCSDVHDYGAGFALHDFLMPGTPLHRPDWVITNPPFRLALEFVERGLDVAHIGVAVICRSVWAESHTRFERLFKERPPAWIVQHVERVPMVKGRYDPDASTATGYSWFVWRKDQPPRTTRFAWLPKSKPRFFRPDDVSGAAS